MKTQTILIVDDDPMITTTLSKVVTLMLKQNVITFNNPVEAIESISRDHLDIDLVISDFIMPDLNGIEFLKMLKDIKPEVISILLTGYADKQNAIKSINEIGIFNYMEKPWDNNNLMKTIQNGLDKKRLTDELNDKMLQLEKSATEIKELYSRLEDEYKKETERNITLEFQVAERTSSIRNLLDNAGQGFLSFGSDLLVHNDYSVECRRIFGQSIHNLDFSHLLYPEDVSQQAYIRQLVDKILSMADEDQLDLYLPLLPETILINGLNIHLDYKPIKFDTFSVQKQMMVILTDVTEKCILESQIEQEKNTFKMVIKVVTSQHDFPILVSEYQEFLREGITETIRECTSCLEALNELFRRVHTLKGNFSMMHMLKTVETLHQAEDKITELQASIGSAGKDELLFVIGAIDFSSGYQMDMEAIRSILGDRFHKTDGLIQIDHATLNAIEAKMAKQLKPNDFMALAPSIRQLGYKKIGDLVAPFLDYTIILSEKYGRLIKPVQVEGCDISLDPERYSGFIRSLVHVFRNAVVHGIERPEDRLAAQKDAFGSIACHAKIHEGYLYITIEDDGKGIDRKAILDKALSMNLLQLGEKDGITDQELLNFIFHDSFTTSRAVDHNSGRGVGLSALKKEIDKLSGTISIKSQPDKGTTFVFTVPYLSENDVVKVDCEEIVKSASQMAIHKLSELTGNNSFVIESYQMDQMDLNLLVNTVFIDIEGQLEGQFFLSMDSALTGFIVKKDMPVGIDLSLELMVHESLSELANIILGNSLGEFQKLTDYIGISTPHTLNADSPHLRFPLSEISLCKICSDFGSCCVGMIKKG